MFPSGLETRNPPSPIGDEVAPASGATDVADSEVDHAVLGSAPKFVASDTSPPDTLEEDKGNRPLSAPAHRPARPGDNSTQRCKLYTRTEVPSILLPLPRQRTISFSFFYLSVFFDFSELYESATFRPRRTRWTQLSGEF